MNENEEFEFRARREREASTQKEPGFGEKAGAMAYGAATGLAGGFGELEKLGRKGTELIVPQTEYEKAHPLPGGRETILPTVKEAEAGLAKLGIKPPREELGGYRTTGDILGAVGTSIPGLVRGGAKFLLGQGSKFAERLAKKAERMGFKLSPGQVREVEPVAAKGATGWGAENQSLANKLASEGTGVSTELVTPNFLRSRLRYLGKGFDKVYKGKQFFVDQQSMDAIRQIAAMESEAVGGLSVSPVRRAANDIVQRFDKLVAEGGDPNAFQIEGEALQKLRNALSESARTSSSRGNAHEIYNLIDEVDASVARNHPEVARELEILRPQYRNTVVLEDLYRQGGIQGGNVSLERLGTMLRGKRGAVRSSGRDIDELGELGRELKMRALWETSGHVASPGESALASALGTSTDALSRMTGLRSRFARGVQRAYAGAPPPGAFSRVPGTAAAGAAVSPLTSDQEE